MFRVLDGLIEDGQALAIRAVNLVAVMVVIMVWAKTRKPGPTIVAVLVSALVMWSVNNFDVIADLIDEEIEAEERETREPDDGDGDEEPRPTSTTSDDEPAG